MKSQDASDLTASISTVVWNATNQIQGFDQRAFLRAAIPESLRLLLVVPVIAICIQGLRLGAGLPAGALLWWKTWLILTLLLPLVWIVIQIATNKFVVSRKRALRAADQQLGSSDRIITADQFLAFEDRDGFMQAAVEDATDWAIQACDAKLDRPTMHRFTSRRVLWPIPAAAVMLLFAAMLGQFGRSREVLPVASRADSLVADVADPSREPSDSSTTGLFQEPTPTTQVPEATPDSRSQEESERQGASGAFIPELAERSQGKLNEGETRESQQSTNPSSTRGASSASGQPSKASDQSERKTKPKTKRKPKPETKREAKPRNREEQPSGATAGQGSSKGADNNAAPNDWASTSQASTPEDDETEDEDDVDDEEEEQESRGGVQPNMRDRRTPVNRDLQIGFGNNRPNPDANGRGGPSGQKKSRGVASLVLGVPIPDRVQGQANQGRIRITQQRITPEPEQSDPTVAQGRSPRDGRIEPIYHPEFSPWLQDFVKKYFLRRREKNPLQTSSKDNTPSRAPQNSLQTSTVAESDTPQS